MGNTDSAVRQHFVSREQVNTLALRKEFNEYLKVYQSVYVRADNMQKEENAKRQRMTRETIVVFARDMHKLLGLGWFREKELIDPELESVDFEEFLSFFVNNVVADHSLDLSESLRDKVVGQGPSADGTSDAVAFRQQNIDVPNSSFLSPENEELYCVPGQLFSQCWSLIFGNLVIKDLNNVNMVCKFFRTVLAKYPPPGWRVARICTVEQRNNLEIGQTLKNIDHMRTITRLEIGVWNVGTMLKDDDLVVL
jgi:hypothetical protein